MLVVPAQDTDARARLQKLLPLEDSAEDSVGEGAKGDWERKVPIQDPGPPRRCEVQLGGSGVPLHHGCEEQPLFPPLCGLSRRGVCKRLSSVFPLADGEGELQYATCGLIEVGVSAIAMI